MKREGIITLFIHGYPWALSYLLDHLLLFEIVLRVLFLKVFCKEAIVQEIFIMILVCKNVYKDVDLLKMFSSFVRYFESVGVCFENSKDVLF